MTQKRKLEKLPKDRSFTLIELIIAAFILVLTLTGVLLSYIRCLELTDLSKNTSLAIWAAKNRMTDINNTAFDQIKGNFNNKGFPAGGLNGKGISYVDDSNPNLLKITISVCWKQRNGLIIGEDRNLDGVINIGEDSNRNGILDSPVQLVTYLYPPTPETPPQFFGVEEGESGEHVALADVAKNFRRMNPVKLPPPQADGAKQDH